MPGYHQAAFLTHGLFLGFWKTWFELREFTGSMKPVGHSDRYIQAIFLGDFKRLRILHFNGDKHQSYTSI